MFVLSRTPLAEEQFDGLASSPHLKKRYKAVKKALKLLAENPRHPGLNTHEWHEERCPHGDKIFEAYAENNTSGAYRIFWCYMPKPARAEILIIRITEHP